MLHTIHNDYLLCICRLRRPTDLRTCAHSRTQNGQCLAARVRQQLQQPNVSWARNIPQAAGHAGGGFHTTADALSVLTHKSIAPSRQAGPSVQPAPGPSAPPHCAKAFGGAMMPASHQVHVLQLVNGLTPHKRQTSGPESPTEAPSWMKSCSGCACHRHTWATTGCGCRFAIHSRGGSWDGSRGSRQSGHVGHGGGARRRGRDAAQIGRKTTEAVVRIWDGGGWSSSLGGQRGFRKAGGRRDGGCWRNGSSRRNGGSRRSGGSDHGSGSCRAASCWYLALSSSCCSSSGCSAQLSVV